MAFWDPMITIAANIAETGILTYPACFPDSVVGFLFNDDAVTVQFVDMFFRTEKDEIAPMCPCYGPEEHQSRNPRANCCAVASVAEQHQLLQKSSAACL